MKKNQILKTGLKNTIFVVGAQLISFGLGVAKALILPIMLGVTNFGYWQVYLLYISYVGVFALGFNDGIYLRYGKYNYEDLPKSIFRTSIKLFIVVQLVIMVLIALIILIEPDTNKQISMLWASLNIPIAGLRGVLIYILQITNQLKRYSFYTILDKVVLFLIIILVYFMKNDNFLLLIIADTFSRVLVLALMGYSCRDLLIGKGTSLQLACKEIYKNINAGIQLMLASFAGIFILGFGRLIVERFESIEVYGVYSFSISTMNLVLLFSTAVGLVVYPTLSRLQEKKYSIYFFNLNHIISIGIFSLLLVYFPLRIFINSYMVDYTKIFEYLPIVFTIVFIQAKMQILINPFFKLLRKEKTMLNTNILGLLMAVILIVLLYFSSRLVVMVIVGTFIAMGIRLYLSEIYLKNALSINNNLNIIMEILMGFIFILFAYQSCILVGFLGYFIALCVYLVFYVRITTIKKFICYYFRG